MTSLWKSYIRNTRSKETEYFSTFCSLKILMFLFYNLSTSKRCQDINFWGSSQVLWVFPHNVTNNDKSLMKSLISIRLQKRLDHLQRIVKRTCWSDRTCTPLTFRNHFYRRAKKKNKTKNKTNSKIDNVLIILHHLTKLHASMEKVKNALKNTNHWETF